MNDNVSNLPIAGIHLDLKYLMPSKAYLTRWVRRLPEWGINTLLLEYEDKFPFSKYPFLQAEGAFTPQELEDFLAAARGAGLRVIPLVQSLSHLEFALAHEELAHLREAPDVPTQIDPRNPEAVAFVHNLMDEVLAFHGPDEFFHVGGDEAWHLGYNPSNRKHVEQVGKVAAWAEHEQPILQRVVQAGKRPMIWDDLLWEDPKTLGTLNLPPETVLFSWGYAVSEFQENGSSMNRAKAYREAGFDVVGGPCLNWGVMTPQHQHCLDNTAAWAETARRGGMLGVINTAWACFHVLPHAQGLYAAATARALTHGADAIDADWQREFLTSEFGAPADGLPRALAEVGQVWEYGVEGMSRPITPVIYGYMDVLLHFGSGEKRRAMGVYPLDWEEVDFADVYRQKMDLLRATPDPKAVASRLDRLEEAYSSAAPVFARLASDATRCKAEAKYLSLVADMKLLHTRIVRHELAPNGNGRELYDAWVALRPRIQDVLQPFMEPCALQRALEIWWAPTAAAAESVEA